MENHKSNNQMIFIVSAESKKLNILFNEELFFLSLT